MDIEQVLVKISTVVKPRPSPLSRSVGCPDTQTIDQHSGLDHHRTQCSIAGICKHCLLFYTGVIHDAQHWHSKCMLSQAPGTCCNLKPYAHSLRATCQKGCTPAHITRQALSCSFIMNFVRGAPDPSGAAVWQPEPRPAYVLAAQTISTDPLIPTTCPAQTFTSVLQEGPRVPQPRRVLLLQVPLKKSQIAPRPGAVIDHAKGKCTDRCMTSIHMNRLTGSRPACGGTGMTTHAPMHNAGA